MSNGLYKCDRCGHICEQSKEHICPKPEPAGESVRERIAEIIEDRVGYVFPPQTSPAKYREKALRAADDILAALAPKRSEPVACRHGIAPHCGRPECSDFPASSPGRLEEVGDREVCACGHHRGSHYAGWDAVECDAVDCECPGFYRTTPAPSPAAGTLEDVTRCLGFLSRGREHVRQMWHEAPDAEARRALAVVTEPFAGASKALELESRVRSWLDDIVAQHGDCPVACGECVTCIANACKVPVQQLRRLATPAAPAASEGERDFAAELTERAGVHPATWPADTEFNPHVHASGIFDRLERFTAEDRAYLFYELESRWCWCCGKPQDDDDAHTWCATSACEGEQVKQAVKVLEDTTLPYATRVNRAWTALTSPPASGEPFELPPSTLIVNTTQPEEQP